MGTLGDRRYDNRKRGTRRTFHTPITWEVVPDDAIAYLVRSCAANGIAPLFSTTSDGNTLSVTIFDDGAKDKYYLRAGEPFHQLLNEIADVHGLPDYVPSPNEPQAALPTK